MISCRKATRLMSDQQERTLSNFERLSLNLHTAMCSACRHFGKQMTLLKTLSQHYVKGAGQAGIDTSPPEKPHHSGQKGAKDGGQSNP